MTEYLVLTRTVDPERDEIYVWEPIGTVSAGSARAAIRERLNGAAQSSAYYGDGEYVAVPARSWQPVTVKNETRTVLRLS